MAKTSTTWKKGQSGNPKGRKPGSGEVARLRALLNPYAEELVMKAKNMAVKGDTTALRLCLERLAPPIHIKDEPVTVDGLKGDAPLADQGRAVVDAMARGQITPCEASTLMQTITAQSRIIEFTDLEKRITMLEQQV